jgi:hypothetical protein
MENNHELMANNNYEDEVYPEEILRRRFNQNVEQRTALTTKIIKLQNELEQVNQWIHLDREEAKEHQIELD